MKTLLRNTIVHSVALFALPYIFSGVKIGGGPGTYILGGILLTVMQFTIKPLLGIISIPFNIMTLGLFSILTDVIILYLLTVLLPKITISGFLFHGASLAGFTIPRMELNTFFAYCIIAVFLAIIMTLFNWIIK